VLKFKYCRSCLVKPNPGHKFYSWPFKLVL